jgi:SAM-dependent methyltransferase
MPTDYDDGHTAALYRRAKEQPWRSRVEGPSFLRRIGDVRGLAVVDLACGEGHYTRLLRRAGAARVLGCDLSERMIDLAREGEAREPLGIEYRVADALVPAPSADFDLAVAAWLLVYARNRAELADLARGLASWVRPGGRVVTLTGNPEIARLRPPPDYRKYGFEYRCDNPEVEGSPVVWTTHLGDASFDIENAYHPLSASVEALRTAGFRDVAVHGLELAPSPDGTDDSPFWADLITHPVALILVGTRAD